MPPPKHFPPKTRVKFFTLLNNTENALTKILHKICAILKLHIKTTDLKNKTKKIIQFQKIYISQSMQIFVSPSKPEVLARG